MKKLNLFLLVLLSAISVKTFAQIGTLTGTGMAVCNQYSFTICPGTVLTPLNYGSQNYACDMRTHEDVSFVNQGPYWRVEIRSWNFVTSGCSANVAGLDTNNNPVSFTLNAGDVLTPPTYTTVGASIYVTFSINGTPTGIMMNRANFQITLNAPSNASFWLTTTNGGLQGYSTVTGSHVWTVYSTPNGNAGPYTYIGTYYTASISINTGGPCYYVRHQITTEECGESCCAQSICASDCDVVIEEEGGGDKKMQGNSGFGNGTSSMDIFPNPTDGMVSFDIETLNDVEFNVSVYNLNGQLVKEFETMNTSNKKATVKWDAKSLSKGIYLVKIVTADKQVMTKKMIVQ